jgi:3-deoxy-D-manno-octulosonate 8-phosphate phosphatase (KDO 8-P phosphatase)
MIKLIILDVDGCLTDGSIIYSNSHEESKHFNVKDGLGIRSWLRLGGLAVIITGRTSEIVQHRAKELQITSLHQGVDDKYTLMQQLLEQYDILPSEVAAIGDDMNDYKMLLNAGQSFTPQDGVDDIKEIVDHVLTNSGGKGAVREMIEILIRENDQLEAFRKLWV